MNARLVRRTCTAAALAVLALVGPQTTATGASSTPAPRAVTAPAASAGSSASVTVRTTARTTKTTKTAARAARAGRTAQPSAQRAPLNLLSRPTRPRSATSQRVPVGFSPGFSLMEEPISDLRRDLDQMRALGINRVRLDLSWARVEGVQGRYDWSQPDRVFTEAAARGIRVLAVIGYQPDWAQRYDSAGRPLSVDPVGFARFAEAAAVRYRSKVSAWEIWNEPNLQRFWIAPPDAGQYAELVNAVAPRIRVGDPLAPILVGAMSPANDVPDHTAVSPVTFLQGIYDRVALRNFDAVSVHPYSYPAMPNGTEEWNTFYRMNQLRQIMVSHGDGATRMWVTEYGAPTGTSPDAVSLQQQADMVVAGIREARRRDYVGPLYLYSLRDTAVDPADRESNFGLLTYDGRAKPAYTALLQEQRRSA
ncbi:cellulase family glycosylhydrolase [Nocardioides rubriscoriae]|uniref:cellulase family glycosylhydrolase n=1 Tax=Nocardioides rubriscoriae TaxID=642762 RepID=UPI0011E06ADE|nr:cellulase family glycosylhydrolase [Nocardioides rubriscoriae]